MLGRSRDWDVAIGGVAFMQHNGGKDIPTPTEHGVGITVGHNRHKLLMSLITDKDFNIFNTSVGFKKNRVAFNGHNVSVG